MNVWATGETITAVKLNLYSQGPAGANDNSIPLFDGVTGLLTKDSGLFIDQSVRTTDSPTFAGLTLAGNLTTSGTVDGVDVAGSINQAVLTTSSPTFAGLTLSSNLTTSGNVDGRDVSVDGTTLDALETNVVTGTNANLTIYSTDYLLSTAVKNGFGRLKASGNTLFNYVKNGDFTDGFTGWNVSASCTLINGIATVDGSQASSTAFYRSISMSTNADVWFLAFYIPAISAGGIEIHFGGQSENVFKTTTGWYGVLTNALSSNTNLVVTYNTDFVGEFVNIMAINMTTLGITDRTEAEMLAYVKNGYFEGLAYSESTEVKSVGKNLFNFEKFVTDVKEQGGNYGGFKDDKIKIFSNGGYNSRAIDGVARTVAVDTDIMKNTFVKIKPSTIYYVKNNDNTGDTGINIATYDRDGNYIDLTATGDDGQFTTESNAEYMTILVVSNSAAAYIEFSQIQIEESATATTYEDYQESEVIIPYVGRSIPSGQTDTTFQTEDLRWFSNQAVSSGVAYTSGTDIDTTNNPTARADGKYMLIGASFTTYTGDIADVDTVAENGTLYFDLAEPIMSEHEYSKSLLLFESGNVYMNTDGTIPDLNVEYCTNIAEQRDKNSSAINSFMKGDTV